MLDTGALRRLLHLWLLVSMTAISGITSTTPKTGPTGPEAADKSREVAPPWVKVNGPAATMDTPGHQGLDSVYRNPNPPPDYFVTDAKYGSAGLGRLKDGTQQMSPDWIRERLNSSFSRAEAARINRSHEPGILRVDKNGNVTWKSLKDRVWRKVAPKGGK